MIQINIHNRHHVKTSPGVDGDRNIYIGRGSPLGNPFKIDLHNTRDKVIEAYRVWLLEQIHNSDIKICTALNDIAEKAMTGEVNLICYCAPQPCHGDVIKEYVLAAIEDFRDRERKSA